MILGCFLAQRHGSPEWQPTLNPSLLVPSPEAAMPWPAIMAAVSSSLPKTLNPEAAARRQMVGSWQEGGLLGLQPMDQDALHCFCLRARPGTCGLKP